MRLCDFNDIVQPNAYLEQVFLADLNRRYAVDPADDQDLHRALNSRVKLEEEPLAVDRPAAGGAAPARTSGGEEQGRVTFLFQLRGGYFHCFTARGKQ
jgi:hypothetical protein